MDSKHQTLEEKYEGVDAYALEAAVPTLTEKLRAMAVGLSAEEQQVLGKIAESCSAHLQTIHASSAEEEDIYMKPISAAASTRIREQLMILPMELGLVDA